MALFGGNTQIPTSATIKYNGNTVKKVYGNSELIGQADIKYIVCPDCNGIGGTGECYYCNYGECHYCDGTGYTRAHCPDCNGDGMYCDSCEGKGYNGACNICGTIYSRESNLPSGAYCGRCYDRTGSKYSDGIELPCEKCGSLGTLDPDIGGTCTTCGGDGYIGGSSCSYCNGVGGPCRYCGGHHYYYCSTCEGAGRIEEPDDSSNLGIQWIEEDISAIIRLANGIEIAGEVDSGDNNNFSSDNCHLQICSRSDGDTYHGGYNSIPVDFFQAHSGNTIYFINHDIYNDQYYSNNCYGDTLAEMEYLVKENPEGIVAILTYNADGMTYVLDDCTA